MRAPLPKVIRIEKGKGREHSRQIFLDDGDCFSLTEEIFYQHYFSEEDTLTAEEINRLKLDSEIVQIKHAALTLLSYRKRSKQELKQRLIEKGFSLPNIEDTIHYLESKQYINDRDFAESFARDKVHNTAMGPLRLSVELKKHGIDQTTIQSVLDTAYSEMPISDLITRLINKKKYNINDHREKAKCLRFLQGKGYPLDQIFSVMDQYTTS